MARPRRERRSGDKGDDDASSEQAPWWASRRGAVVAMEAALVAALFTLMLRVRLIPLERMVTDRGVFFMGTDPYYHLRHVHVALANFPRLLAYDPWTFFPQGTASGQFGTLFDAILAGAILLAHGGRAPDAHTVQMWAAVYPAVLGALTVVPVYLAGRVAFGRVGAAYAAVAVSLVSGEFLVRSLASYFDHHAAEALFSTLAVAALLAALARGHRAAFDLSEAPAVDWRAVAPVAAWGALAGVALSLYLLVWNYGVLFVAIFDAFFVAHFVLAALRRRPTDGVAVAGAATFLAAAILLTPAGWGEGFNLHRYTLLQPALLLLSAAGVAALQGLRVAAARLEWPPWAYPAAVAGAAVAGYLALWLLLPGLVAALQGGLVWVTGAGDDSTIRTIAEAQPTKWRDLVDEQGLLYVPALVALPVAAWRAWRTGRPQYALLAVWGVAMLVAALNQVRFNYYLTVAVALLNGLLVAELARATGLSRRLDRLARGLPAEAPARGRRRGRHAPTAEGGSAGLQAGAVALVALFLVPGLVAPTDDGPHQAWEVAASVGPGEEALWAPELAWMRENTPPVPGFRLDALYDGPIDYPEGAYGVLAWWDYGHWIQLLGERPPVANPFQQAAPFASRYFTAPPAEAEEMLREWEGDATVRYVMIDAASATGKFGAIAQWAGKDGVMYPFQGDGDSLREVRLPDGSTARVPAMRSPFWESQLARLYFEDGNGLPNYRLVREKPDFAFVATVARLEEGGSRLLCLQAELPSRHCLVRPTVGAQEAMDRARRGEAVPVTGLGGGEVVGFAYDLYVVSRLKTFERVPGALLQGETAPHATVVAQATLTSEAGRTFTYTRQATADGEGRFSLRVPYATGAPEAGVGRTVNATGPYLVTAVVEGGPDAQARVDVPDAAVLEGAPVAVAFDG